MMRWILAILSSLSLVLLLLSMLFTGDLSEGGPEIRNDELWWPMKPDFAAWTNPPATLIERLATPLGVRVIRSTSRPTFSSNNRIKAAKLMKTNISIRDHFVVVSLTWPRIALCVMFALSFVGLLRELWNQQRTLDCRGFTIDPSVEA